MSTLPKYITVEISQVELKEKEGYEILQIVNGYSVVGEFASTNINRQVSHNGGMLHVYETENIPKIVPLAVMKLKPAGQVLFGDNK